MAAGDKGVRTFPKRICLKVNVIAQLQFEIANHNVAVQHVSHYTSASPLAPLCLLLNFY